MLDWVYTSVLGLQESFPFTAVTQALTRALKGFFFGSNLLFGGRQSTLTLFTRWPIEDSFPVSRALGGKCRRLSSFCYMSRLQGVRICGVFVGGNSNYRLIWTLKFYNHISFLNTRWQLSSFEFFRVQDSIEYSITWRMINRSAGNKIHFRKQPPLIGNLCALSMWYLPSLWIYAGPW